MRRTTTALTILVAVAIAGSPLRGETPSAGKHSEAAARKVFKLEPNIDRSGNDIRRVELVETDSVTHCERMCRLMAACVAFTFVKRSTTVPKPICRLKDTAPYGHESECCTSGVLTP